MKRLVFDMPVMVWIGVEQEDFLDACGSSFSGTMNFVRLNGAALDVLEPASLAMFSVGLAGPGWFRRRKIGS